MRARRVYEEPAARAARQVSRDARGARRARTSAACGCTPNAARRHPRRDLDLLADPPGYRALRRHADIVDLDGDAVPVASLEDLIEMKRAAGRPQDQIDIESLEVARSRIRGTRQKPNTA